MKDKFVKIKVKRYDYLNKKSIAIFISDVTKKIDARLHQIALSEIDQLAKLTENF